MSTMLSPIVQKTWYLYERVSCTKSSHMISLISSDHPVFETMQISTILAGLSVEYDHVVAILTDSRQPYDVPVVTTTF